MKTITLIPGDGIGPEIVEALQLIFREANVPVQWEEFPAGQTAFDKYGELLPKELMESIARNTIALKGPCGTPIGKGFRSVNVSLRIEFDLYANLRPVYNLPGIVTKFDNVDVVLFRENVEDLYVGLEIWDERNQIADAIKRNTRKGCEDIITAAFEYARAHGRKKVSLFHKANILKVTEGLFLRVGQEVAAKYPDIQFEDLIIDNAFMQVIARPERFDVIVTTNMFGDILSDLLAGMVGGLGVVAGANLGHDVKIFEAVHGTAPDIAGKGLANPMGLLQSSLLMLENIGMMDSAAIIRKALYTTLANKAQCTRDIGGTASTMEFAHNVARNLERVAVAAN
jgi:isocitrate dehydrogenase (NAD+)